MCQSNCRFEESYTGDCTIKSPICVAQVEGEIEDIDKEINRVESDLQDMCEELQEYVKTVEEYLALIGYIKEEAKKSVDLLASLEEQKEELVSDLDSYSNVLGL